MDSQLKICVLIVIFCGLVSYSEALGECYSDSDCGYFASLGYHCCKGTIWCCPSGYICTGSATCISIGVIVGPIVGLVCLIVCIVITVICCRRRRQQPGVVYNPNPQSQVTVAQTGGYGQQPQGYGQPQQGYGQPQQGYGQPYPAKA